MKKLAKALVGVFAAVAMMLTGFVGATTAFAAESTTVTVQGGAGNTYAAYKLFNAEDIGGGKFNYTVNAKYTNAVKAGLTAAGVTNANDTIAAVSGLNDDNMRKFADAAYKSIAADTTITAEASSTATDNTADPTLSVEQGYYLIAQTNKVTGDDTVTKAIVKTAGQSAVTVTLKKDKPTVDKKVEENADFVGVAQGFNDDAADNEIGKTFRFQLNGTLPSDYDTYNTYDYIFHDTLSKGLDYQNNLHVYAVNSDSKVEIKALEANTTDDGTGYTVTTGTATETEGQYKDGSTLTVAFSDLKKAVAAKEGETVFINATTKIVVEYDAKLNDNAIIGGAGNPNKVNLEYSNNPYDQGEGTTGHTPDDHVVVFTFAMNVNKYKDNNGSKGDKLNGATFTLYKANKNDPSKDTAGDWDSVKEIAGKNTNAFEFKGIDAGIYKLVETKAPDGYNVAEALYFRVVAEYSTTSTDGHAATPATLTSLKVMNFDGTAEYASGTFTVASDNSSISTDMLDKEGSTLPETGGMGTTILYVAGAVLVIAAGAWFGLRRKASAAARRH